MARGDGQRRQLDARRSNVWVVCSALQDEPTTEALHRARAGPGVGVACTMSEKMPPALGPAASARASPTAPGAAPSARPRPCSSQRHAGSRYTPGMRRCTQCASRESRITDRRSNTFPEPGSRRAEPGHLSPASRLSSRTSRRAVRGCLVSRPVVLRPASCSLARRCAGSMTAHMPGCPALGSLSGLCKLLAGSLGSPVRFQVPR